MNDDDLKKLWQQQPLREPPSAAQLVSAMQKQTSQLRRIVDARDLRELVACGVVIIIFGCYAYFRHARQPVSRLGDLIVIGSAIYIACKLIYTRRATPPAPPGATTVESLRAELNAVRAQSRLLGSVLWWYLLPLFIGIVVMTWGGLPINNLASLLGGVLANILATLFFVAVYAFIYWLNQWARAKQLLPLEAQLESLLRSAETGEPLDETHVANLRPIVLSMAAADQAKPVEFKVSFWQIALWGEVGFVGIWFFGLLVPYAILKPLAMFDPEVLAFGHVRFFQSPHLAWIVPFFLAGLVYSWLLQKLTERAVGISNLGIHLHKGQNLILWDEIKEIQLLKVLNIRSLWLIRETGEKTIMPWTGLERHSDLKAAVERFAPANHPIRKYLSLLRRI